MLIMTILALLIAIPLNGTAISATQYIRIIGLALFSAAVLAFTLNGPTPPYLYSGLVETSTLNIAVLTVFLLTGILIQMVFSPNNFSTTVPKVKEYALIVLFTTLGGAIIITSADLITLFLGVELQSFGVYIITALDRDNEQATSAGLKYFLLGALSSALIVLGLSLVYYNAGVTSYTQIYEILSVGNLLAASAYIQGITLGLMLITVGILFKVAAVPLHYWAPDVYDGAPTIITVWLTIIPKYALFIGLINILISCAGSAGSTVYTLLLGVALLSIIVGSVAGLSQTRIKRLLAYSTITHVGFMLFCVALNTGLGYTAFVFYIVQYSIINLGAFAVLLGQGYITKIKEILLISELKGQYVININLALAFTVFLFSMAGAPPLLGFFAKYNALFAGMNAESYVLTFVGIISSVISAVYYLRVINIIWSAKEA